VYGFDGFALFSINWWLGVSEDAEMEYVLQFISSYEGIFNFIFGFLGFVFGLWRYYKERAVRNQLKRSQQELDQSLARLKHLEGLASGLKQYSAAV
jgi:hypothetical protein